MAARLRDAGSPFCVGAALDLNSNDPATSAEMARRRIDAGAEFLLTQPAYEPERVARFIEAAGETLAGTALFIGMMPLLSRDATERVPARLRIVVAEHILRRVAEAEDPKAEGLAVFAETLLGLTRLPRVAGINFMPFGFRANIAEEVAFAIRDALDVSERRR
jgi:homocysteine S-methyltransferase